LHEGLVHVVRDVAYHFLAPLLLCLFELDLGVNISAQLLQQVALLLLGLHFGLERGLLVEDVFLFYKVALAGHRREDKLVDFLL